MNPFKHAKGPTTLLLYVFMSEPAVDWGTTPISLGRNCFTHLCLKLRPLWNSSVKGEMEGGLFCGRRIERSTTLLLS